MATSEVSLAGAIVAESAYAATLEATREGISWIRRARDERALPLLDLPYRRDDLGTLKQTADQIVRASDVVLVLGTGGSSLGGKSLVALADMGFGPYPGRPPIHFLDNIDPVTFDALFAALEKKRVGLVTISKSGTTAETLMQLFTVLERLTPAIFVAITEPADNPLRRIATQRGALLIDHDPGLGGRYSVLSCVGLLPALIAGLDVAAVRQGAAAVLDHLLAAEHPAQSPAAIGAALNIAAVGAGIGVTVLMPYCDRLAEFGLWFRQLWAESLGKQGRGTIPVRAMGTVDQHSQLQLYLDGPADKLFTLVTVASGGTPIAPGAIEDARLSYLAGHALGDLLEAEARATYHTLRRHGRPTRLIALDRLDETAMGGLFMQFMLETILAARLIGVDAFDQPAVEEGKILARQYLAETVQVEVVPRRLSR